MPFSRPPLALLPHLALRGEVARASRAGGLAALILVLLARLFGRAEALWQDVPDEIEPFAPRGIVVPAVGRAPHAACIEAGLVPDWILPGVRNRGMRPRAMSARHRRSARPVRAPPLACAPPR